MNIKLFKLKFLMQKKPSQYSEAQILTISDISLHKGHETSQKYIMRMLEYSIFKNETSVICQLKIGLVYQKLSPTPPKQTLW